MFHDFKIEFSFDKMSNHFERTKDQLNSISKNLINYLKIEDDSIAMLTYSAVVKYFVTERPKDSRIEKGAMLIDEHSEKYLIKQVFLDKNHNLVCNQNGRPYGRRIIAINIDKELQDICKGQNLIIFE